MNLNIEKCEFNIQYQEPVPEKAETLQQQIMQDILQAVQRVIVDAIGEMAVRTHTLPDIQIQIPEIDLAAYQRAPTDYVQNLIIPAVYQALEPMLAEYQAAQARQGKARQTKTGMQRHG